MIHLNLLMVGQAARARLFRRNLVPRCARVLMEDGLAGPPGQPALQTACMSAEDIAQTPPQLTVVGIARGKTSQVGTVQGGCVVLS